MISITANRGIVKAPPKYAGLAARTQAIAILRRAAIGHADGHALMVDTRLAIIAVAVGRALTR
jgi:hypothetical protein